MGKEKINQCSNVLIAREDIKKRLPQVFIFSATAIEEKFLFAPLSKTIVTGKGDR